MHTWSIQFQTCISVGKVINTRWCILNVFGLGDWWCSVFVLQEMFPCLLPWRVTRWNCPATSRLPFSPTVFALSSIFVTILLSPFTRECIKSKREMLPHLITKYLFQLRHSWSVTCRGQALVWRKDFGRTCFLSRGLETREIGDWQRQGNGCWRLQMPRRFLSSTNDDFSYEIRRYRYYICRYRYDRY